MLGQIIGLVGGVIDKAFPDKTEAAKIKGKVTEQMLSLSVQEIKSASSIIAAEASGESWLQRNWRPVVMIWFAGLVGAHWFGFTPENLGEQEVNNLLEIVKIGIGGYVVGRSAEKVMKEYKK